LIRTSKFKFSFWRRW